MHIVIITNRDKTPYDKVKSYVIAIFLGRGGSRTKMKFFPLKTVKVSKNFKEPSNFWKKGPQFFSPEKWVGTVKEGGG